LIAGIVAALALAGAAGWYFFLRPREAARADVPAAGTSTTEPAPVAAGPVSTTPPDTVPGAAATLPSAPSTTPPATLPAAAAPAGDARALLQGGNYPEAARAFASDLRAAGRSAATIQLFIACSTDNIAKAVANVGAMEMVIVPTEVKGKGSCYRVGWGIYPTPQAAAAAVRSVPAYFEQPGVRRTVMRAAEILP
jgi:septal ring-binding cell division protein DamX